MLWQKLWKKTVLFDLCCLAAVVLFALSDRAYLLTKGHWKCFASFTFSDIQREASCDPSEVFWRTLLFFLAAALVVTVYTAKAILFFKVKPVLSGEISFSRMLCTTELKVFASNIGLTADDRITLYLHVPKTDTFINIGRESPNYKLCKSGRKSYKDGFIRDVFNDTEKFQIIDADPVKDKEKYIREVSTKSRMKKRDVRKLTMYSCGLYGNVIKTLSGDSIGVLLIESNHKDFTHIKYDSYADDDCTGGETVKRPLCDARLKNIFARESKRLSYFMDVFKVQERLFDFEEGKI